MTTAATTRYGLSKIVLGSDNVDVVADFNNNWDAIDAKLGTQTTLSSSRPAAPVQGMLIYETDTGAVRPYSGSAWGGVIPVATSSSLPANPIRGDLAYLSDAVAVAFYSGSAWHLMNLTVCTNATRPTGSSVTTGSLIYETDTLRILVYNGSSWVTKTFVNYVCTSTTHPSWAGTGLEIYETDTGLSAVYSGSNYLYGMQQIAATQLLGSTTASVTFGSIPAVSNLILKWRLKGTSGTSDIQMQIDGSVSSVYQSAKLGGRGGAASVVLLATTYAPIGVNPSSTTADYFASGTTNITGWNNANTYLSYTGVSGCFDTTSSYWTELYNGQYLSVGPHTSIKISLGSGSFAAGSEFALYAAP